jgi:hypothetical protein
MRLMRRRTFLLPLLLVLGAAGCRSAQLAQDQDQFRARLLDLYTNQIMDNLIRADRGLPIVQLDYSAITGTITQNGMASFTSTQTTTNTKMLVIPTVVRTLTHSFMNVATFNPSAYQTNALTVTANPLLDHNEVYDAYLEYIDPNKKHPGSELTPLMRTPCEPPQDVVLCGLVRRCGDMYYWIPAEYKTEFQRLSLVTTVQRGQPLTIPDKFDNTVATATVDADRESRDPPLYTYDVDFSKPMPNGSGIMELTIKDKQYRFPLQTYHGPKTPPNAPRPEEVPVDPGRNTTRFLLVWDPEVIKMPGLTRDDLPPLLRGQSVKVALDFFKPTVPNTMQLLKNIDNNLQLQRIQVQSGRSLP